MSVLRHLRGGIPAALLILYSGLVIFGALHHEPWRDEAQVWLLARDLGIPGLLKNAPYEGSPVLWHLLVMPFAKAGIAYQSQSYLHLVIAIATVAVFLYFAPFDFFLKTVFTFSFLMAFEYAVVARSYVLSVFLLFLAAAMDREKTERPVAYGFIIFCLFNTNAVSFGPAIALSGLYLFEAARKRKNKMNYLGFLLMMSGGVCAVFQLLLPADSWKTTYLDHPSWQAALIALGDAFFPAGALLPAILRIIIACTIFPLGILGIVRLGKSLFYLAVSSLWLFYIFIFVYAGSVRHHGFLLIHLIVALWIGWSGGQEKGPRARFCRIAAGALSVAMLVSIPHTVGMYLDEYRYPFSGSREMAMFIEANGYGTRPIVAHRPTVCTSLLPYLPGKRFWYADSESYGTYYKFDRHWREKFSLSEREVLRRAEKVFPKLSGVAILFSREIAPSLLKKYNLRLSHKTEGEVFGYGQERYWLYLPNVD
jgi:hypothetical protein